MYRLGILRRKGRCVNRFLQVMMGWFLVSGILSRNFVVEIRKDEAEGSAQAGGYESTDWKRIFVMVKQIEVWRRKEELGSNRLRRGRSIEGWCRNYEGGSSALRAVMKDWPLMIDHWWLSINWHIRRMDNGQRKRFNVQWWMVNG